MSVSALVCLAPGSEETEAVTTASVAADGDLTIVCSRGAKLLADAPLVSIADQPFNLSCYPVGCKVPNASATARCW